jgi:hypothetical protein
MIISHLIGGLGNQMFQYAAGRALSLHINKRLIVDVQDFNQYKLHNGYELERTFNINNKASLHQLESVLGKWRSNTYIRKKISTKKSLSFLTGSKMIVEPQTSYWNNLFDVNDNAYLVGYWQTEKYFKSIENVIRSDFTFAPPISKINFEWATLIKRSNSVSIHIRRGDIASNHEALAFHGLCSIEYYERAICYMQNNIENPIFYVFSDDISWVKKSLDFGSSDYHFVDNNIGKESYNDMRLMSLCRHNIIANSSFSWWGAWLNNNDNKLVITPEKWFLLNDDTLDITPSRWLKL